MTAAEWGLLIFLSLLWGGSFFFNAVAVTALPPLTIVLSRCMIGAATLILVLRLMGKPLPFNAGSLPVFFGMGLVNNVVPQVLIVWAQQSVPSGLASILNATTPFFAVLCLHGLTTTDRATPAKWLGVVVGFVGVAVLLGLDQRMAAGSVWPQIALLGASFSYGLSAWWGKKVAALGVDPIAAAAGQLSAASLLLAPLAYGIDNPLALPLPAASVLFAVLGLALLSTALAYIVYFRILATAGPTSLSLVTLIIPVSAILLGILFLGETFAPRHALGMAIIASGLLIMDGRLMVWWQGRR
jgi:drug/metabolite transporter (DMT)-like permease